MLLLGVSETARRLRIHVFTLRRWEERGILLPMRDSSGRRLFIEEQVEELAREREARRQCKEETV